jgi:alpha-L-fucosidase
MEDEAVPIDEYMALAKQFRPKPNAPRDFARLAKAAGQKYMVMTTKHHEGFCMWDTKLTNYCAAKQGPGRESGARVRGRSSRRRPARRLLLLTHGLAPS